MAKDEKTTSDLADLAREFGRSKVTNPEHEQKLREIGFTEFTNNALIAASVFSNAVNGDMKAVEKWQELTGSADNLQTEVDSIGSILAERAADGKPGAVRKTRSKL